MVTPTMKSLEQVEPRRLINSVTAPGNAINLYIITQPGSYYLTADLTGVNGKKGLWIASDNMTIDLNGFALVVCPVH